VAAALGTTGAARTAPAGARVAGAVTLIEEMPAPVAPLADAHAVRTHSSVELALDMDSLAGWSGLTVYAQFKSKNGRNGSGAAAFTQNYSNIDADDFQSFGEVFVEQRLLRARLRIKAGRLDFNSEFAGTDNGGGFLNASMGYSPSIWAAPTFPLPTSGVNVFVEPREHLTIGVGVFNGLDGAPAAPSRSSRFEIAQANQTWTLGSSTLPRVGLGYFRPGPFSPPTTRGDGAARRHTAGTASIKPCGRARCGPRATPSRRASIRAFAQFRARRAGRAHSHRGGGLTFSGSRPRVGRHDRRGTHQCVLNGGGEFIGGCTTNCRSSRTFPWWPTGNGSSPRGNATWIGSVFTMRTIVSF
jgi:hypothetical protein